MRCQGWSATSSVESSSLIVATTDSNRDGPIFPDLSKDMVPSGRDQLWVADLTYVAIPGGFA